MEPRDVNKYIIKRGNKPIYAGTTKDLDRRENEHKDDFGDDIHIVKVGRATTREAARDWEKEQEGKGIPIKKKDVK